jgi:hypothetical protein
MGYCFFFGGGGREGGVTTKFMPFSTKNIGIMFQSASKIKKILARLIF